MTRFTVLFLAATLTAMADEPAWRGALTKSLADKSVTIAFTDTKLASVVAHVGSLAGIAIVVPVGGKAAEATITISVRDIRVKDALRLITRVNSLDYGLRCGAVVVGTPEEIERVPAEGAARPVMEGGDPTHHESWQKLHDTSLTIGFDGVALDAAATKLSTDADVPIAVDPALQVDGNYPKVALAGTLSALHAATLVAHLAGAELVWDNGWRIAPKKPAPPPEDKK